MRHWHWHSAAAAGLNFQLELEMTLAASQLSPRRRAEGQCLTGKLSCASPCAGSCLPLAVRRSTVLSSAWWQGRARLSEIPVRTVSHGALATGPEAPAPPGRAGPGAPSKFSRLHWPGRVRYRAGPAASATSDARMPGTPMRLVIA